MHHKNRKPKTFKGCCTMCSCRCTDGTRNGRLDTLQETAAELRTAEGILEHEEGPEPVYLFGHVLRQVEPGYWLAQVDERTYEVTENPGVSWNVEVGILAQGSHVAQGVTLEEAEMALRQILLNARHAITRMLGA